MSSLILNINRDQLVFNTGEKSFSLDYQTSLKFHKDKVNFENDDFYLLLDGVILNKKQLLENSHFSNWAEYLLDSYRKNGKHFFKIMKGSF